MSHLQGCKPGSRPHLQFPEAGFQNNRVYSQSLSNLRVKKRKIQRLAEKDETWSCALVSRKGCYHPSRLHREEKFPVWSSSQSLCLSWQHESSRETESFGSSDSSVKLRQSVHFPLFFTLKDVIFQISANHHQHFIHHSTSWGSEHSAELERHKVSKYLGSTQQCPLCIMHISLDVISLRPDFHVCLMDITVTAVLISRGCEMKRHYG